MSIEVGVMQCFQVLFYKPEKSSDNSCDELFR